VRSALGANADDSRYWLELASDLRRRREYHCALLTYEAAERRFPALARLFNNKGVMLREWGRLDDALEAFEHACRLQPGYVQAVENKGNVLELLQRPAEAAAVYRQLIEAAPDRSHAWNNLGNCEKQLGMPDAAEKCYQRALELDPSYVDALFNLAGLSDALGRRARAAALLERLLELDPDDRAAQRLAERIRRGEPPEMLLPPAWSSPDPYIVRASINVDHDHTVATPDLTVTDPRPIGEILRMGRAAAASAYGYRTWDVARLGALVQEEIERSPIPTLKRPRLFISYRWESAEHIDWVARLVEELEDRGYDTVFDRRSVEPSVPEMISGVAACSHFVPILTEGYRRRVETRFGRVIEDGWVYDEYDIATRLWQRNRIKLLGIWRSGAVVPTPFRPQWVVDLRRDELYGATLDHFFAPRLIVVGLGPDGESGHVVARLRRSQVEPALHRVAARPGIASVQVAEAPQEDFEPTPFSPARAPDR
jgi:tetratricopeptide (TPR) repeat protein